MSGITGFCRWDGAYGKNTAHWMAALDGMCGVLAHRGGKRESRFHMDGAYLAQTSPCHTGKREVLARLPHENGAACAVADAALYHSVGTASSVEEFLLRLLLRDGADALEELNGAFAGAVFVESRRKLYLFRDHMGLKPLFYKLHDGGILFGSEIKAILRYPGVRAAVTREGLCEVLGVGPARRESSGVFDGIFSVLPGHYAVFDETGFRQTPYWRLGGAPCADSFEEAAGRVTALVTEAVSRQGGGKICSFLSGGLDSSIVTALLALERDARVDTFSFDFTDSGKHFAANDFQSQRDQPYAEQMARVLGTRHTYLECDSEQLADALPDAMRARDLPGMADIDASLLVFSRQVADAGQYDAALTGECADELFNGYPWFHRAELVAHDGFPWSRDIAVRTAFLRDDAADALDVPAFAREAYDAACGDVPSFYAESDSDAREKRISYLTIKWVMATLLDRADRMCASAGLTARAPFADKRIAEYLWSLPWAVKNAHGVKGLLRTAFTGLLPDEILYRKKNPYPKTYNPAYERLLASRLQDVLADANAPIRALADAEKVRRFIHTPQDYGKPWYGQLMAGPQMLAYWLQMNDWLREYDIQIIT